jgi:phospholipid/cholesterol/gamma-HCH transport system substrate-binding protein
VYTDFAKLNGLTAGANVSVAGMNAGQVDDIQLPSGPNQKFRLKLEVREDLHPLVRTNSVASIETQGVVGGSFLAIATGSADHPEAPKGSTLPSKEPFAIGDLIAKMGQTVDDVQKTVSDSKGKIDAILTSASNISSHVNRITGNVANATSHLDGSLAATARNVEQITKSGTAIADNIRQVTDNIKQVTDDLRSGRGTFGKLLTDDQVYGEVASVTKSADVTARRVASISGQIDDQIKKMTASGGPAEGVMTNITQTMNNARVALGEMSDAMKALEHNFLLRGFFHDRGYFNLSELSPAEYREGVLAQGDRQRLRVWLKADLLFSKPSDGHATLTDAGRARIDSAMAGFLPYLPDAVLVVEGYATDGAASQQMVAARARAGAVRWYLLDRFHLDPRSTGLMPLGAAAPDSPTGKTWSGVALSLFVKRERMTSRPQP